MTEKAEAAQKVLSQLSTWMWKCDPPTNDQIENETYIRFKELLQVRRLRREKLITPPTDTLSFFPLGLRCQRGGSQPRQHLQR
jgi:hypothetical protein